MVGMNTGQVPDSATSRALEGPDYLEAATLAQAAAEVELEAKGYASGLVRAALARARGAAEYKVKPISPDIRPRAFYDILGSEITKAENWLLREQSFLDSEPVPDTARKEVSG